MKVLSFITISLLCFQLAAQHSESVVHLRPEPWGPMLWESNPPAGCPVPQSTELSGIVFTGRHADYSYADTWYPSWASDGNMYSPYTDGVSGIWSLSRSHLGERAVTGQARIEGSDPLNLKVISLGAYPGSAAPYGGRYPCGSLVYNGVWYYGTYCLDHGPPGYNWGKLRPFTGFRISRDHGLSWEDSPHSCGQPLFEESGEEGKEIKLGAPHLVDFGQNLEHSPDGKAYLVGHGEDGNDPDPRPANLSWVSGDQIYLARVEPGPDHMNDASKYEFFAGFDDADEPVWTNDYQQIQAIFQWNNHCGCVTMTYFPELEKYIMCVTDGWPTVKYMDTYFLESDRIEGPWKLVSYLEKFGEQAYFVNIPSKFISEEGRKAWLSYSGNFAQFDDLGTNPPGGRYGWILQEFEFLSEKEIQAYDETEAAAIRNASVEEWKEEHPLISDANLARKAKVTVSSVADGYVPEAVIDGVVDGYPHHPQYEWATAREGVGARIRLEWETPIPVSRIWLFDRPSHNEHIVQGGLSLSDGTTIHLGELPNSEYAAKEIAFPQKEILWMEFVVLGVGRSKNIGLAEIAVFE